MTPTHDAAVQLLLLCYFAAMGACVGSFVNVVVVRLQAGLSLVRPRSRCPRCGNPIAWYDNIPLLSFVLLRGRCRVCRQAIPWRYPLVELLTTAIFAALFVRFGVGPRLVMWLPLSAALIAIVFLDLDAWWIPDAITYPAMLWASAWAFAPGGPGVRGILTGALPAVFLWLIAWGFQRLTGREGMGMGDVKLLALMGLVLGGLSGLFALFLASVQGTVLGGLLLLLRGDEAPTDALASAPEHIPTSAPGSAPTEDNDDTWQPPPHAVPFGPFLVLATFEVLLLPDWFRALPWRLATAFLETTG